MLFLNIMELECSRRLALVVKLLLKCYDVVGDKTVRCSSSLSEVDWRPNDTSVATGVSSSPLVLSRELQEVLLLLLLLLLLT